MEQTKNFEMKLCGRLRLSTNKADAPDFATEIDLEQLSREMILLIKIRQIVTQYFKDNNIKEDKDSLEYSILVSFLTNKCYFLTSSMNQNHHKFAYFWLTEEKDDAITK